MDSPLPLTTKTLERLLNGISNVRAGIIGDFCLDVYWLADMKRSVLSRETPHFPLPIVEERMSPGGAGNVACNIAALAPQKVIALGVVGQDWRGTALSSMLEREGIDTKGLIQTCSRTTNTYIKPLRSGISETIYEDPRLDFENYAAMHKDIEDAMLTSLDAAANQLDVLCVCDQMTYGCITPAVNKRISQLAKQGMTVIVDSRERITHYHHVIVKPNEVEAIRSVGGEITDGQPAMEQLADAALGLSQRNEKMAIVTLGANGCLVAEQGQLYHVPAQRVDSPIDICGAGDTFLSSLACALAGGASACEAAQLANLASSITIKKIGTTGTASREEILHAFANQF